MPMVRAMAVILAVFHESLYISIIGALNSTKWREDGMKRHLPTSNSLFWSLRQTIDHSAVVNIAFVEEINLTAGIGLHLPGI